MTKARAIGQNLLRRPTHWDHGNRLHWGHAILGEVALAEGRPDAARAHLLSAGRSPGSPQLNSFGPDMRLASKFLRQGNVEPVVEYLKLCEHFWASGRGEIGKWIEEIGLGRQPMLPSHSQEPWVP
ncbi:MAG TPA: hypothetical protein VM142_07290 [Acidimicrobiales bacterium]|nr:hypothetical protein [Acidimicrobiales bacterium]